MKQVIVCFSPIEEIDPIQLAFYRRSSGRVGKPPCAAAYENEQYGATRIKMAEKICSGRIDVSWTKVIRSMKPRKGKTMSKAGGCVCICDTNTTDTGLRVVSYPGLRRQDTRLGGQMEQVKSVVWSNQSIGNQWQRWVWHTGGRSDRSRDERVVMIREQSLWHVHVSNCSTTSKWDDWFFWHEITTDYLVNGLDGLRDRSWQYGRSRSGWNDLGGAGC